MRFEIPETAVITFNEADVKELITAAIIEQYPNVEVIDVSFPLRESYEESYFDGAKIVVKLPKWIEKQD